MKVARSCSRDSLLAAIDDIMYPNAAYKDRTKREWTDELGYRIVLSS